MSRCSGGAREDIGNYAAISVALSAIGMLNEGGYDYRRTRQLADPPLPALSPSAAIFSTLARCCARGWPMGGNPLVR